MIDMILINRGTECEMTDKDIMTAEKRWLPPPRRPDRAQNRQLLGSQSMRDWVKWSKNQVVHQ
jgi:hypothetical protein